MYPNELLQILFFFFPLQSLLSISYLKKSDRCKSLADACPFLVFFKMSQKYSLSPNYFPLYFRAEHERARKGGGGICPCSTITPGTVSTWILFLPGSISKMSRVNCMDWWHKYVCDIPHLSTYLPYPPLQWHSLSPTWIRILPLSSHLQITANILPATEHVPYTTFYVHNIQGNFFKNRGSLWRRKLNYIVKTFNPAC